MEKSLYRDRGFEISLEKTKKERKKTDAAVGKFLRNFKSMEVVMKCHMTCGSTLWFTPHKHGTSSPCRRCHTRQSWEG